MSNEILIYHSRIRLLLIMLVSLIFLAIGIAMLVGFGNAILSGRSPYLIIKLQYIAWVMVGTLLIALGGAVLICGVRRLALRSPCIVINDQGILDNVSCLPAGPIRWSEIKTIRVVRIPIRFSTMEFLDVEVVDPAAVLRRQPGWKRVLMRLTFRDRNPVSMPRSVLPISLNQLTQLIESRRPASQ